MRARWAAAFALVLSLAGCKKTPSSQAVGYTPPPKVQGAASEAPSITAAGPAAVAGPSAGPRADAVSEKKKRLTLDEARHYMLELINRDRKTANLPPVELDPGPPGVAGQAHAEDMAARAYLGHWGSDGSVPEQRLTEAGGADLDMENAACFTDMQPRTLDPKALVDPAEIERTESMFFNETPPNDGHRKNILRPAHLRVGIGIAQPIATTTEIPVPCISQEFVDPYGTYAPLPKRARVGQIIHVAGEITLPAVVKGVGISRLEAPKPIAVAELNRRRSYPIPAPYQMYWPPGYQTPIPLRVSGAHFSIDVPLNQHGGAGLYEVSVWGTLPGSADAVMLSLRTILVEK